MPVYRSIPPGRLLPGIVLALTCLCAGDLALAADFADSGPLRIRDHFLPGMGLLAIEPSPAAVLPAGVSRVEMIATTSNTFAMSEVLSNRLERRDARAALSLDELRATGGDNLFYLDGEVYRLVLALDHGLTSRLEVGFTLQWLSFSAGMFDGVIEGVHDKLRVSQGGRTGIPRSLYTAYKRSGGFEYYADGPAGGGLGDTVLRAKYQLNDDSHDWFAAIQALVKLPTWNGDGFFSSGSTDIGIQLLGGQEPLPLLKLHYAIGLLRLGDWPLLELPSQLLWSGMVGVEVATGDRSAWIAQMTASQSPFTELDLPELGQVSLQVSLGYKRTLAEGLTLFLALTENIAHFDNSADVGMHVGLSRTSRQ